MATNRVHTGIPGLDEILGSGFRRTYSAPIRGPPGAGKTIFGLQFLSEGVETGETSLYINLGEPGEYVTETLEQFNLGPEAVHVLDLSPSRDEFVGSETDSIFSSAEVDQPSFVDELRSTVERLEPDSVLLDGVQGFNQTLRGVATEPKAVLLRIVRYLRPAGVSTFITNEVANSTGECHVTEKSVSNLADNMLCLRYVEAESEFGKVIGVLNMRTGDFQRGLRTFEITRHGLQVGEPLDDMRGMLTGTPEVQPEAGHHERT